MTAQPAPMVPLAGIAVTSNVATADGAPFCRVEVTLADGTVAAGQLTPGEVVGLATDWIAAAQAARDDAAIVAAVVAALVEAGSDRIDAEVSAVELLDRVRKTRQSSDLSGELRSDARFAGPGDRP